MKDYSNVTFIEYTEKKIEMLNDLGRNGRLCSGVECKECPLHKVNNGCNCNYCYEFETLYPDKALEKVMEYEPKVDWTQVPIDTKILVRDYKNDEWVKRHFAGFEYGIIYAWDDGLTSFTTKGCKTNWIYAKLYKEDKEG